MMQMDLINVYIQEVTRRLPEKTREDISLELQSTIYDMLPDDFSKKDVENTLEKLGDLAVLAARYKDRPMHVIGPKFYDMYVTLLKLVFVIVAVVTFVTFFIQEFSSLFGNETPLIVSIPTFLGEAIWVFLGSFIQVFFWVTIVFFILERTVKSPDDIPLSLSSTPWTPKDLESTPYIPLKKKITKGEVLFGLFWTILWVALYFNAMHIIGIYRQGTSGLEFAVPVFNQETLLSYLALVIIVVILEICRVAYMAIAREWTVKLAVTNTLINAITIVFLIMVASNPDLFHAEFAPYMANLIEQPIETVQNAMSWIAWLVVSIVIVTSAIDTYNGFRKAKITRD